MSADYMIDISHLEPMLKELREQRNRNCEPKSNENRRYLEYSVSSITWIINDLKAEDQ